MRGRSSKEGVKSTERMAENEGYNNRNFNRDGQRPNNNYQNGK